MRPDPCPGPRKRCPGNRRVPGSLRMRNNLQTAHGKGQSQAGCRFGSIPELGIPYLLLRPDSCVLFPGKVNKYLHIKDPLPVDGLSSPGGALRAAPSASRPPLGHSQSPTSGTLGSSLIVLLRVKYSGLEWNKGLSGFALWSKLNRNIMNSIL